MEEILSLHVPTVDELWYRQQIQADPDTMSYNRGYAAYPGYDPATGCIAFPESEWADWHAYFVGQEPERFAAYLVRDRDGAFLGEVNVHRVPEASWYEMGIVIEAKYRGLGYGVPGLRLLLRHAFEALGADAVHNYFESDRVAAVRTHLAAGFTKYREHDELVELLMTKARYFSQKGAT